MNEEQKIDLAGRLAEYPLLRVLLYEKWFRVAFVSFLLVLLGGLIALPRVWVTSPKDFEPIIKVSLLDLVQAWSLNRTGQKSAAQARYDEADYAWQTALANNRADPKILRAILGNYLEHERALKETRRIAAQAAWLLRLTSTNTADLELAAQVFERRGMTDYLVHLLGAEKDRLSPPLEAIYLKTLFDSGDYRAFNARWIESSGKAGPDRDLVLYRAAYLSAWGPATESLDALASLKDAAEVPDQRELASRLLLVAAAQRGDLGAYEEYLNRLTEWRADTLLNHLTYWKMLVERGQKAQAIELATSYPHPPVSGTEVIQLAQLFALVEQPAQAIGFFNQYASEFGYTPNYWVAFAQILTRDKRWSELRDVGVRIRTMDYISESLSGYSYFVEGLAEQELGRIALADAAFKKMLERGFTYPQLAFMSASTLLSINRPTEARTLLSNVEDEFDEDLEYWLTVFKTAHALKLADSMVVSGRHAYELHPKNPVVMNNYAAALLIQRDNPEEAIRLTLQLFIENPTSLAARINHASALLMNDRAAEAEELLNSVPVSGLTKEQLAMFRMNVCEIHYRLGRIEQARAVAAQVDDSLLYPAQREWLETIRKELM